MQFPKFPQGLPNHSTYFTSLKAYGFRVRPSGAPE